MRFPARVVLSIQNCSAVKEASMPETAGEVPCLHRLIPGKGRHLHYMTLPDGLRD